MTELVTKEDLALTRNGLELAIQNCELRVMSAFAKLEGRVDRLELRLLVRLGGLIAVGIAVLAALIKL